MMLKTRLPISVIILSYNEEKKIEDCIKSVIDFVQDIFVVDSFSTDNTLEIIKKYPNKVYQHEFENYGKQRNWALSNLPIETQWVLNLNSDQRVTEELKKELLEIFLESKDFNCEGFLIARKTLFMGRWIKFGGHYPVYDAILFKKDYGACEESQYDQLFIINGKIKKLKGNVVDIVSDSLTSFTLHHNRWSDYAAMDELLPANRASSEKRISQNYFGNVMEKRRFLKTIYLKSPIFIRSFMYFIYRYFFRLGFLDGKEGLIFHLLQGFWFRFLIDAKIYEYKQMKQKEKSF